MKPTKNNIKIIFGLKVKQLRQEKSLSLSALAKKSGLSVSYLNEIESGKKYPKADKIAELAYALKVTYDKLVSLKLTRNLAPLGELLESNIFEQLPLVHYGIDINKLIVIMANAPLQLSALVTTLIDMAKSSELSRNNFSRTALRTYKEFNENYFPDLEKAVEMFSQKYNLKSDFPINSSELFKILEDKFEYKVDMKKLSEHPELSEVRGLFVPGQKNVLLLNKKLSDPQKTFILGKELAYKFLKISDRSYAYTGSRVDSFDQLLNNLNASYFSTALIINKDKLIKDLKSFFGKGKWDGREFLKLIKVYNSTPEMFIQRLASLSSKFLDLHQFFFLRFNTAIGTNKYSLTKELRLNTNENPGGYQSVEHYCRRWISIGVLKELEEKINKNKKYDKPVIGIRKSQFYNSGDQYLTISIARINKMIDDNLSSVTIGFLVNDKLKQIIKFWNDPKIKVKVVNDTCERCVIADCKERIAPPVAAEEKTKFDNIKTALEKLMNELQN
ncbi:MAG: helix-turn-helix transcriptional regulator [Bacteroidetes bacterium]|nr:helix-turn-helix transcriptional regulator [Bacteroidota bacterium]MCH7770215.1 helix-turn-helix transcriptional regulator [Bacteroidota bacterium]